MLNHLLQGVDCHCLAGIEHNDDVPDKVPEERCDKICPGNSHQTCGGANAVTIVVAECESGWTRFGGKCFQQITKTGGAEFRDAAQSCAQLPGASLWFPSTLIESQFVIDHLW